MTGGGPETSENQTLLWLNRWLVSGSGFMGICYENYNNIFIVILDGYDSNINEVIQVGFDKNLEKAIEKAKIAPMMKK